MGGGFPQWGENVSALLCSHGQVPPARETLRCWAEGGRACEQELPGNRHGCHSDSAGVRLLWTVSAPSFVWPDWLTVSALASSELFCLLRSQANTEPVECLDVVTLLWDFFVWVILTRMGLHPWFQAVSHISPQTTSDHHVYPLPLHLAIQRGCP